MCVNGHVCVCVFVCVCVRVHVCVCVLVLVNESLTEGMCMFASACMVTEREIIIRELL